MSGTAVEWIAVFAFLILLAVAVTAEIIWLTRKGWTSAGRAAAYVLVTDLVSLGVGFFIAFVCFFVMFMMVMGPAGQGGDAPQWAYVMVTALAVILPVSLLFLAKRLGLSVFKIRAGRIAWIYSLVSSMLLIVIVFVPPPLLYYLSTLAEWKK